MTDVGVLGLAYLLGTINFALLIGSLKRVDIRQVGSGNPGASNVGRALGRGYGALTMAGDTAKGLVAAMAGELIGGSETMGFAAGALAVVGHCYPVWHRFRGGKGVATAFGMLAWLAPIVGLVLAGVWLATVSLTKISSLGSLASIGLAVPGVWLADVGAWAVAIMAGVAALVAARHRGNIQRIVSGDERKMTPS